MSSKNLKRKKKKTRLPSVKKVLKGERRRVIHQIQTEIEKAYGGCRKCYGKGYSTQKVQATMHDDFGNEGVEGKTIDLIPYHPCSCDRGKQIERMMEFFEKFYLGRKNFGVEDTIMRMKKAFEIMMRTHGMFGTKPRGYWIDRIWSKDFEPIVRSMLKK